MAPLDEPVPVITPPRGHVRRLPGVRKLASSSQWKPYNNRASSRLTTLLQQTSGMYFYHSCVVTWNGEADQGQVSTPFCRQPSEWDHNVALSCDLADDNRWSIGVFFASDACHFRQARMNREVSDGCEYWSITPHDGRSLQIFEHKVTDPHHMHSDPPPGLPLISFCPLSGSVVICWATTIHVIEFP